MEKERFVDVVKGICLILIIYSLFVGSFPLTFIVVPSFFFMSGFYDRNKVFAIISNICLKKMISLGLYFLIFVIAVGVKKVC